PHDFTFSTSRPPPRSTLFPYTTLFRSGEVHAVVLGEHLRIDVEVGEQARRIVRRQLERDAARLGAREEQQLVDRAVDARQLLEQRLHSLLVLVTQCAARETLLGVLTHQRPRGSELVCGVRRKAPQLL